MNQEKQRTYGQFPTPPALADLLLGFAMRRPNGRLLDPSSGAGALLARAAQWQAWQIGQTVPDTLTGVELDPAAVQESAEVVPHATIWQDNFFTCQNNLVEPFDAIVGNPPYTRAEWIGRLQQASLFDWAEPEQKAQLVPTHLWEQLDNRAGLHAYFFLHAPQFLREGGRLAFVVPNSWLDVAYGEGLKRFLLNHYRLVALIESTAERWFKSAKVNTCVIVLEKCADAKLRQQTLTRFIRLHQPLDTLLPLPLHDNRRPTATERLIVRLLGSHSEKTAAFTRRTIRQSQLSPAARWGLLLRAPEAYSQAHGQPHLIPLKGLAKVQRGYTTGANDFFYLNKATIDEWRIEPAFRRPVLKSLRGQRTLRLTRQASQHEMLWISPLDGLHKTAVSDYLMWGIEQGIHRRRTCAARAPWYSLSEQPAAQLVLPKGIWRRHLAPLLLDPLPVDQQLYQIRLRPDVRPAAAAALLNSSWFALQCELEGRVNFGDGVLWLATYELQQMRLPDLCYLPDHVSDELADLFDALAQRPQKDTVEMLDDPVRQALDSAVFDLLQLPQSQRRLLLALLRERLDTRLRRAKSAVS